VGYAGIDFVSGFVNITWVLPFLTIILGVTVGNL